MKKFKIWGVVLFGVLFYGFIGNLVYEEFSYSNNQITCGNQKYVLYHDVESEKLKYLYNTKNRAMFWKWGSFAKSIIGSESEYKTLVAILENHDQKPPNLVTFIPENDKVTRNDIENLQKCYTNHTFKVIGIDGLFQSQPANWKTPEEAYEE